MSTVVSPPRVGLVRACYDPQLFGIALWPKQSELLRPHFCSRVGSVQGAPTRVTLLRCGMHAPV